MLSFREKSEIGKQVLSTYNEKRKRIKKERTVTFLLTIASCATMVSTQNSYTSLMLYLMSILIGIDIFYTLVQQFKYNEDMLCQREDICRNLLAKLNEQPIISQYVMTNLCTQWETLLVINNLKLMYSKEYSPLLLLISSDNELYSVYRSNTNKELLNEKRGKLLKYIAKTQAKIFKNNTKDKDSSFIHGGGL